MSENLCTIMLYLGQALDFTGLVWTILSGSIIEKFKFLYFSRPGSYEWTCTLDDVKLCPKVPPEYLWWSSGMPEQANKDWRCVYALFRLATEKTDEKLLKNIVHSCPAISAETENGWKLHVRTIMSLFVKSKNRYSKGIATLVGYCSAINVIGTP